MTSQSADDFVRVLSSTGRDASSLAKHWVEVVYAASNGSLNHKNLNLQFKEFTTPTILGRYIEYYADIAGSYAP
jgi:hypothetical protein